MLLKKISYFSVVFLFFMLVFLSKPSFGASSVSSFSTTATVFKSASINTLTILEGERNIYTATVDPTSGKVYYVPSYNKKVTYVTSIPKNSISSTTYELFSSGAAVRVAAYYSSENAGGYSSNYLVTDALLILGAGSLIIAALFVLATLSEKI